MSTLKYRLTVVRGKYYLYNLSWREDHPWFQTKNKKRLREYMETCRIRENQVDGCAAAKRERLYNRIPRVEEI